MVVAFGKAARVAFGADGDFAFEAAVVGIVDQGQAKGHAWFDGYKARGAPVTLLFFFLFLHPGTPGSSPALFFRLSGSREGRGRRRRRSTVEEPGWSPAFPAETEGA